MQDNALVSIIIPCYNRMHLIGETLDTIIAQTYTNWECLVIDDHSTDRSRDLVKTYCKKDKRIQLHIRPDDRPKGANACRNYGLELATGKYIQFLDSDDLLHPKKFEIQLAVLKNENVNLVFSPEQRFRVRQEIEYPLTVTDKGKVVQNLFEKYVSEEVRIITGAPLFNREILEGKRFDERLSRAQEADFFAAVLVEEDRAFRVDHPLFYYRQSDDSITGQYEKGLPEHTKSVLLFHQKALLLARQKRPHSLKSIQKQFLRHKMILLFKQLDNNRLMLAGRVYLEALTQAPAGKKLRILASLPGLFLYAFAGRGKRLAKWNTTFPIIGKCD